MTQKKTTKKTTKKISLGKKIDWDDIIDDEKEKKNDEKKYVKPEKGIYRKKPAIQIFEIYVKKDPESGAEISREVYHKVFDYKGKPTHIGIKKIPFKDEVFDLESHGFELEHKNKKRSRKSSKKRS